MADPGDEGADHLAALPAEIWAKLRDGAADRRSPIHVPVVASIAADGSVTQRVMVLRAADEDTATLRFHTDSRSPKIAQLDAGAPVSVLTYDAVAAVQLRLTGNARIDRASAQADAAWSASTTFARRCYLTELPPGSPTGRPRSGLPVDIEGRRPSEYEVTPARANFALVIVTVTGIDWLHLASTGHRRAKFERSAAGWTGQWCIP